MTTADPEPRPVSRALELLGGRHVCPSILSADFSRLGAQVSEVMEAGARIVHVDVMDGHFVPPITIGPLVVGAIADQVHDGGGALDVHLMIERPEAQVEEFARAGADCVTVHAEASPHLDRLLGQIREAGCLAGLAVNPGTPVAAASGVAGIADLLLCMSVNPGWGGQSFLERSPERVRALRELGAEAAIEVDGGIDAVTAPLVAEAGATLLVAGSAVFGADSPGEAFQEIAAAAGFG